MTSYLR